MKNLIFIILLFISSIFLISSNDLKIINTTSSTFIGEAVEKGLDILELDSIKVTIVETPHNGKERNYLTRVNDDYFLFIDTNQRKSRILRIVAHELIHIKQYSKNHLIDSGSNMIEWQGKLYDLEKTPYNLRPWEAEARRMEYKLQRKIEKII